MSDHIHQNHGETGNGIVSTWLNSSTSVPGTRIENSVMTRILRWPVANSAIAQNRTELVKNPSGRRTAMYPISAIVMAVTIHHCAGADVRAEMISDSKDIAASRIHPARMIRGKKTGLKAPPRSAKPSVYVCKNKPMPSSSNVSDRVVRSVINRCVFQGMKRQRYYNPAASIMDEFDSNCAR